MKQIHVCLITAVLLVMAGPIHVSGAAHNQQDTQQRETSKEKDKLDKAGESTEKAMKKAGDAAEKGLDAAGKGTGVAVEKSGRAVTTAAKETGKALGATGSAIADFFDGDDDADEDRVREAQQALQSKGYYSGPIDGIVGPKTQAGVREFQADAGLKVTGKVDDSTAERLGID
jgi:hypothetical protein